MVKYKPITNLIAIGFLSAALVSIPLPAHSESINKSINKTVAVVAKAPLVTVVATPKLTAHEQLLSDAGIAKEDWPAADFIIMAEGHYDPCVRNGNVSDCAYALKGGGKSYGICQALPGKKMASAGADWATNPVTQIKWCNQYAKASYGGWNQAKAKWISRAHWNPRIKQYVNGWW